MNIERAKTVPGFMNDEELLWLAEQAEKHTRIVEIGSWRGRSTRALADNTVGHVWAVDTWDGRDNDCLYEEVQKKGKDWLWGEFAFNLSDLMPKKVTAVRTDSVSASRLLLETFDMVFIDGSHGYDFVKSDILAWMPKLTPGGLLCGHDFADRCPGVKEAVREFVPGFMVMQPRCEERSIWWMS